MSGLLAVFAPPIFADEEITRRARILNTLLWIDAALVIGLYFVPEAIGISHPALPMLVTTLAHLAALVFLARFMRRGKVTLASELLMLLVFAHITLALFSQDVTGRSIFAAYALLVACAGVLLDRGGLARTAVLCALAGSLLIAREDLAGGGAWLELLKAGHPVDWLDWAIFMALLAFAAWFIDLTQQNLRAALARTTREVAERRQAEEALRSSRDFLRGLINALDDPLFVKDERQRWVAFNHSAALLLGKSEAELEGQSDADLFPPDVAARVVQQDRQVMESGAAAVFEEELESEGEPRILAIKKSRFINPLTGERFISATVRDITEQKRSTEALTQARDILERQDAARVTELHAANESLTKEIHERQEVEIALRRSMQELVTFMDVTPGIVFLLSEDGRVVRFNGKLAEQTGFSGQELERMNGLDLVYEDDRETARQAMLRGLEEGQSEVELRMLNKEGQVFLYYISGARLIGQDGKPYFAAVGLDITSLFVTEAALRESEERFRNLVEAIPDIIMVVDFSGQVLYATPSLERQTGLTLPDLQNVANQEEQNPAGAPGMPTALDSGILVQAIQEFVASESQFSEVIVNSLVDKDNQTHWYSSILSRVQFRGQPALQVISRDITEQKRAEADLYRSQERLSALLNATTDATFLVSAKGIFLAVNEATAQAYGASPAELLGKSSLSTLPAELAEQRQQKFLEVVRTGRPARFQDYGLAGWSDNSLFPVFSANGTVEAVAVFSRDITEQKLAEEALRESQERYALAAQGANDVLWDLNLRNKVIYLSPRWKSLLGYPEEESRVPLLDLAPLVHDEDLERVRSRLQGHLEGSVPHLECEFRLLHADGEYRWVLARGLAVRNEQGAPYRAAGSMTDISENKRISDQLLHDALHDALTGLPNRALLADRLEHAIQRRKRYQDFRYAVLYLDLDGFKDINDTYTHNVGDLLLIAAAQRMKMCLRAADTLARLGGDEFVILQTEVGSAEDAISLAARLQEELGRPFYLDGASVPQTSASIGIVLGDENHHTPEDILRDADIAMYQAKYRGKACHLVFDAYMRSEVQARVRLEADLRQALARGELEVYYHPIIALQTGRFTGFEALARWRHPTRGWVSPAEFIPLAENSRLVIPLDRWVLREACRQARAWQGSAGVPIQISVNLSGRHFPQADLVESIQEILSDTRMRPADLVVEITESAFMENIELATVTLRGLQSIGVGVELDDFGKGYSSLNYLREMPVDTLKIDSSFIRKIATDEREAEVVQTIIQLGHTLDLRVVAEGVETVEQMEALKKMGCDYAQGYLFAQPLDPIAAAAWIRANSGIVLR